MRTGLEHALRHMRAWVLIAGSALFLYGVATAFWLQPTRPLRVGILHSQTGPIAPSGAPIVQATLMAIREINEAGGVLGRSIEPVIADGKSDWPTFGHEAERLIVEEQVEVIFGCYAAAERKAVVPVVEKYKHVLFYPNESEGLEISPYVVTTAGTWDQQALPGVLWMMQKFGPRLFLVGTDGLFSRGTFEQVKEVVTQMGATIVGESYLPLDSEQVQDMVAQIAATKPNAVISTIDGTSSNNAFFKAMRKLPGFAGESVPIYSGDIGDPDWPAIGIELVAGSYTCWDYFERISSDVNQKFVRKFKRLYGSQAISDPMESGYISVYLWAHAVRRANSFDTKKMLKELVRIVQPGPEGFISVDRDNLNCHRHVLVGQIGKDGLTNPLWRSFAPKDPQPYSTTMFLAKAHMITTKTVPQWNEWVQDWYKKWGNKWSL